MAYAGKLLRLSRFRYRGSQRGLIVPIDHGLTLGPVDGLVSVARIGAWLTHHGVTGIIAHKGLIERLASRNMLGRLGVMMHLNGMSSLASKPDTKQLLTRVDTAVRLGVDGVSVQLNYDGDNDPHNMQLLGAVVDEAQRFGLPVLTMLYDKVESADPRARIARLRHLMRISIELGSDALKLAAPSNPDELPLILDGLCEDIPIFFAGGSLSSDEQLLSMTRLAATHGASGLCMGRNVFQRESADLLLDRLSRILRGRRHETAPVALVDELDVA
ncbi:class I fructose-bisphosphate aldolase [Haliangium sp.]|uniref:class I fructose-bisphosphate aldolase n=1 Tax=Haliangium sp. TaxID=2663208 RepID=UPI003D0F229B